MERFRKCWIWCWHAFVLGLCLDAAAFVVAWLAVSKLGVGVYDMNPLGATLVFGTLLCFGIGGVRAGLLAFKHLPMSGAVISGAFPFMTWCLAVVVTARDMPELIISLFMMGCLLVAGGTLGLMSGVVAVFGAMLVLPIVEDARDAWKASHTE